MLKQGSHAYPWWRYDSEVVAEKLGSNLKKGLSLYQIKESVDVYGLNKLPEEKHFSLIKLFISQFSSIIVLVLIGALVISAFLGELVDAGAIGLIIIFNGIVGFFQEYHAEKSIDALKQLTHPTTRVVRDGIQQNISSLNVVPGDIIVLEAGDLIPADGRVIQSSGLLTQEAALTGESLPVEKIIESLHQEKLNLGDRRNMVFMGTSVVQGKGIMIVTQTGISTQLGTVASLLKNIEQEKTPLQIQLNKIGLTLVVGCSIVVGIIFLSGILRAQNSMHMLLTSLSLAVAAIPEGLPAVITITLALGLKRMAKKKTLVRRLTSIETLGCTNIICTDKTGTLTKNELMVSVFWVDNTLIQVSGTGFNAEGSFSYENNIINPAEHKTLSLVLKIGVLCNGASIVQKNDRYEVCGDPTEGAFLIAAQKAGIVPEELVASNKLIDESPFSSERKKMSSLRECDGIKNILYVKGAPDILINHATSILIEGAEVSLTDEEKQKVLATNIALAEQGMRVLAVAFRSLDNNTKKIDDTTEQELVFVGLVAMTDSIRPEAQVAIEECSSAGIRTIMITGDHQATATAVARKLNLLLEGDLIITGAELDELSDDCLKEKINAIRVYARTSPEHKLRIVSLLRDQGHIVAVTGDGVNDAAAIKAADIGIAMGITGTEVTKQASDMVITDDNFASIVSAIKEGRGIYDNLMKFLNYLISANLAEILVVFWGTANFFSSILGDSIIPLLPIHILWINLVTDGPPAIALGLDPACDDVMVRPPRRKNDPIFTKATIIEIGLMGIILAIAALIAFKVGLKTSIIHGYTMTLTTFVFLEFVRAQLIREQFNTPFFSNRWLFGAIATSLLLHFCILYLPCLQGIFKTTELNGNDWLVIGVICSGVWVIGKIIFEILKKLKP